MGLGCLCCNPPAFCCVPPSPACSLAKPCAFRNLFCSLNFTDGCVRFRCAGRDDVRSKHNAAEQRRAKKIKDGIDGLKALMEVGVGGGREGMSEAGVIRFCPLFLFRFDGILRDTIRVCVAPPATQSIGTSQPYQPVPATELFSALAFIV